MPEVRRLLVALAWTAPIRPGVVLAWSRWRRRHQARARRAHYQRREQQMRLEHWAVTEEQGRLPLSYCETSVSVPAGWEEQPCAYLLLGLL